MRLRVLSVISTLISSAGTTLADPVYWAGYLCAGVLLRRWPYALGAGLAWAVLIEAGGWIIYPGRSIRWHNVGPPMGALVATGAVWWVRDLLRKNRNPTPGSGE